MKKVVIVIVCVIVILAAIYGFSYYSDYQNIKNFRLPNGVNANDFLGDEIVISRLGYSIQLHEENGAIVKMTMLKGNKVVAESSGKLEVDNSNINNMVGANIISNETSLNETSTEVTFEVLNPNDFVTTWGCGRATIEVEKVSNNTYTFNIYWGNSAWETVEWSYTCNYDEEKGIMVDSGTGKKTDVFLDDDQAKGDKTTILYTDGKAEFSIENGYLIWNDKKENAGEDMKFESSASQKAELLSEYVGTWYPKTVVKNGKTLTLKDVYGEDISSSDCLKLNEDGTYTISYGLMTVDEDGRSGTYSWEDGMIYLNAKDGSSSGYVVYDDVIHEERDGATVTFEKR